jgi:hypothetical protein
MNTTTNKNRCKALTKAGKSCRAAATDGGLCYFHGNPEKAVELGRIGGRGNRHATADASSLPPLETTAAVRKVLAQLVDDVYVGRLHPRIASGLAPLLSLQLRVIENSDLERRLRALERRDAGEPRKEEADEQQ